MTRRPVAINARRELVLSEHKEQAAFVLRLRTQYPEVAEYMTAVPHGGQRHKAVAAKLRAEGVTRGYPDILIDYPCGPFSGMRIEMKRRNATQSDIKPEQRAWGDRLLAAGFLAVVARGADHAMDQVEEYLALGESDRGVFAPAEVNELFGFELLLLEEG